MKRFTTYFLSIFCITIFASKIVYSKSSFYVNKSAQIEMRVLLEETSSQPWEELLTMKGEKVKVLKESFLNSSDIEGISTYNDDVIMHFKRESWEKVRNITRKSRNKRVAIIKDKKVISSPVIKGYFTSSAMITSRVKLDMDWFLKGFGSQEPPAYMDSKEVYIEFLEGLIKKNPEDTESVSELVNKLIYEQDSPQYERSIPLLNGLVQKEPNNEFHYQRLVLCYSNLKKSESALQAAKKMLSLSPRESKWTLYPLIASIYLMLEDNENALSNYINALKSYEDDYLPYRDENSRFFDNNRDKKAEEMILNIKNNIESLKAQK